MGVVSPDRVNITVGTLATSSLRWVQREQTQLLIALLREAEVAGLPPTARSYGPVLLAERWLAGTAVAWPAAWRVESRDDCLSFRVRSVSVRPVDPCGHPEARRVSFMN